MGTDDVALRGVDSIVASADAAFDESARTFLEFVGSPATLETLNRIKGSIPPRRDIALEDYPRFFQEQFADFERARHIPAGHARQITPDAFVEVNSVMSDIVAARDVDRAASDLVDAYSVGVIE